MAFTLQGLLLLLAVLAIMLAVPAAAVWLGVVTIFRRRKSPTHRTGDVALPAGPSLASSSSDVPPRRRWRKWLLFGSGLVGALLSVAHWVWRLYRETGLSAASQARADLPLTLPFFAGLGFFGGFFVGLVLFEMINLTWPQQNPDGNHDEMANR